MQQANKKVIESISQTGFKLRISLHQPKEYLFSNEYNVEIVGTQNKALLTSDMLTLLVGREEMNRLRVETRRL